MSLATCSPSHDCPAGHHERMRSEPAYFAAHGDRPRTWPPDYCRPGTRIISRTCRGCGSDVSMEVRL